MPGPLVQVLEELQHVFSVLGVFAGELEAQVMEKGRQQAVVATCRGASCNLQGPGGGERNMAHWRAVIKSEALRP